MPLLGPELMVASNNQQARRHGEVLATLIIFTRLCCFPGSRHTRPHNHLGLNQWLREQPNRSQTRALGSLLGQACHPCASSCGQSRGSNAK